MAETVLIVTPDRHDAMVIQSAAAEQSLETAVAKTYRGALAVAAAKPVALIVCEQVLPDGSWKDLLSRLIDNPEPPSVVVMAEACNRALWAEAISLGARDVIAKPLDNREAQHVISLALPRSSVCRSDAA